MVLNYIDRQSDNNMKEIQQMRSEKLIDPGKYLRLPPLALILQRSDSVTQCQPFLQPQELCVES